LKIVQFDSPACLLGFIDLLLIAPGETESPLKVLCMDLRRTCSETRDTKLQLCTIAPAPHVFGYKLLLGF
jgi:hypothetical protein